MKQSIKRIRMVSLALIIASSSCIYAANHKEKIAKPSTSLTLEVGEEWEMILERLIAEDYEAVESIYEGDGGVKEVWEKVITECGEVTQAILKSCQTFQDRSKYTVVLIGDKGTEEIVIEVTGGKILSQLVFDALLEESQESFKVSERPTTLRTGNYIMDGTLTLPITSNKVPVILFVHDKGVMSQEGEVEGIEIFKELAQGLAKRGIASYRYDKRTGIYPKKLEGEGAFTFEEIVIEDMLSAIKLVSTYEAIDRENIYLIGQGVGGLALPEINRQTDLVKGYILLDTPARDLIDVAMMQVETFAKAQTWTNSKKVLYVASNRLDAEVIRGLNNDTKVKELNFFGITNALWSQLNSYNQVEAIKEIKGPMMIIQGEKNQKIGMRNFLIWQEALLGSETVSFIRYPYLNERLVSEASDSEQVSQSLMQDMAQWIKENE